jgi:hypothetical protein
VRSSIVTEVEKNRDLGLLVDYALETQHRVRPAEAEQVKPRTLRRAYVKVGVQCFKRSEQWRWQLPAADGPQMARRRVPDSRAPHDVEIYRRSACLIVCLWLVFQLQLARFI